MRIEDAAQNTPAQQEAFVAALTRHQAALRGFCQASLGHGDEASEALQRTNIVLWKKSGDWDPATEFLRWAFTVARYEVMGVVRDRRRAQRRVVFNSEVVEKMLDAAARRASAASEAEVALEHCLGKISKDHKATLAAYYVQGCSIRDISRIESRGETAVRVGLLRIRKALRACIESRLAGGAT